MTKIVYTIHELERLHSLVVRMDPARPTLEAICAAERILATAALAEGETPIPDL